MRLEQLAWKNNTWEVAKTELESGDEAQLILAFGHPDLMIPDHFEHLRERYPAARIVGGSTAGNVLGASITDEEIVATAIYLEKSHIKVIYKDIEDPAHVERCAAELMEELKAPNLKHVFIISDGLNYNGSEIARAVNIEESIPVTGGLAGDSGRFKETYVLVDGEAKPKRIVFIGFYGEHLTTNYGCFAGWGEFGVDRVVTKSKGNVIYELDGQPALELYKNYLGDYAEDLPSSGLRFPLSIRSDGSDASLIRTLLGVNEENQSLILAGDVPEGAISLLMKGNVDDLIDSANEAAKQARIPGDNTGLAIVISCVGRKLLMDQLTEEELETVQETLGDNFWLTGFYSYGELAPYSKELWQCKLHNQTMTLMTLYEA